MYFFEAYYMCEHDVEQLYECNFNAWMFGPVAIPLHKEYKAFTIQYHPEASPGPDDASYLFDRFIANLK